MAESQEKEKMGSEQQSEPLLFGEALQAARIAKELTLQDVSDSLRYSVKQIDALEKSEFDLLPDAMITRGFIRNYARLLELDAEPLLASYRKAASSEPGKEIIVQSSMRPIQLTKESQPWLKYILASILVLLFLLAWLFYVDYMPKSTILTASTAPEVVEVAVPSATEPLPEIALPAAQREADGDTAATEVLADSALNDVTTVTTAADLKSSALPLTQQASAAASAGVAEMAANKTVGMVFTEQSWVRITDKSGKHIYEKMSHAGDKETVNAAPPLTLIIGNASATKLKLEGQDIDLAPNTQNNVARITLE